MRKTTRARFEPGSWWEYGQDMYIGAVTGLSHTTYFLVEFIGDLSVMAGLSEPKAERPKIEGGELKVVAVGYGRTGTYSLFLALEQLGFPTLHTRHVYEVDEISRMWVDRVFQPSVQNKTIHYGEPDFDLIASYGFQATCDLPVALYYEQILQQYPDCKFILTMRENSEVWFRSWEKMTASSGPPAELGGIFFTAVRNMSLYLRWLYSVVNNDPSYLTSIKLNVDQHKAEAIKSYEDHNRRVQETIPSNQLLLYSVKEGWEPLCEFLGIADCPTTDFPKTNSLTAVQAEGAAAYLLFAFVLLLVGGISYHCVCKRRRAKELALQSSTSRSPWPHAMLPGAIRTTLLYENGYDTSTAHKRD